MLLLFIDLPPIRSTLFSLITDEHSLPRRMHAKKTTQNKSDKLSATKSPLAETKQTWNAGPPSAEFIMLHPTMNAKRNSILKMTSVGGSSTKLSKCFTQGRDSSTLFFNLLFKLIFLFFLCWKVPINSFSRAASIDSSLLSCPTYCWRRKLRDPQISSSDASGPPPRRLWGSQILIWGNFRT